MTPDPTPSKTPPAPRRRSRWLFIGGLLVGLFLLSATGICAQTPTLPRVDSLMTAGAYDEARTTLDRWWSAREEFDVPGSDRARGLMLRARLAGDVATAEPDYLAVVLGYPTSDYAPEALLRLGQGLLAAGEPLRAAGYLQRLVADYPGRTERARGLLWLARSNIAARRSTAACSAARQGLRDATDPDLAAMLRIEEAASCAVGAADREAPAAAPPTAERPTAERPAAERPAAERRAPDRPGPGRTDAAAPAGVPDDVADGRYAAQTGAFRYEEGARDLVARLEAAGYRARMVFVPRNSLLRVRVGRFGTVEDAARAVTRLRSQGFDAYVVGDVREEREP